MSMRTYDLMQTYTTPETQHVTVYWGPDHVAAFAQHWPCCDIPETGFATFDRAGDLIDLSENAKDCQPGGGLNTFVEDRLDDTLMVELERMFKQVLGD